MPSNDNQQKRCGFSKLIVPAESSYLSPITAYIAEVTKSADLSEDAIRAINSGFEMVFRAVIENAVVIGEQEYLEVSIERVPLGIQLVIHHQGVPFDPEPLISDEKCSVPGDTQKGDLCRLKEYVDGIEFRNLGKNGREIVLTKYSMSTTVNGYIQSCGLGLDTQPPSNSNVPADTLISIQPMISKQALEVCRILYGAYGYSYFYPHMYYPERLIELNRSGHLFSAIATTETGELVGHCALMKSDLDQKIAEIGIGAVKPEYRSRGILRRLSEFLVSRAKSDDLVGVFTQAVTNHTFSQQVGSKMGFKDTGILLAYVPESSSFKGITDHLNQRDSMVIQFLALNAETKNTSFLPIKHEQMLTAIYNYIGLQAQFGSLKSIPQSLAKRQAAIRTVICDVDGLAKIFVDEYGEDVVSQVRRGLRDLCMTKIDVVYLYLDLSDPLTCDFVSEFENLGFFFCGLLPAGAKGDVLILQYLNNVRLDFGNIHVKSDFGLRILNYIQQHYPN